MVIPYKKHYNDGEILEIFNIATELYLLELYWQDLNFPVGGYISQLPNNLLRAEKELKLQRELKEDEEYEYKPDPEDPKGSVIRVKKRKQNAD